MGPWLQLCGVLLGGISLFKLSHRLWEFGLSPIFQDLLTFYHNLFHPIAAALNYVLSWFFQFPHIPEEAIIIFALIGAAFTRFSSSNDDYLEDTFVMATLWPLWVVIGHFRLLELGLVLIELAKTIVAALFLFAINAYSN